MVLRPFVYILFIFNSSAFAQSELGGSDLPETQSAAAQDVEGSGGQCKPAQVQRNRDIIQRCNSNWANWGIDTPPANELRNENDCESVASAETLLGCGDAVLALPIFLGELAVMGIAATIPIDRNTFGFVSQNGSLQEIQAFLTGEFFHEQCGLYPWQESTYPSEACPDRESHLDPEAHGVCRQQAVQRVQEFVECRSSGDVRALKL